MSHPFVSRRTTRRSPHALGGWPFVVHWPPARVGRRPSFTHRYTLRKGALRFALLTLLLTALAPPVTAAPSHPADAKIAPPLLAQAAPGEETEFLVVLTRQADLGAAAAMPTKAEKGRFVYETLRRVALATQPPLIAWLQEQGVPHRAYYIVNAFWVRGDLNLARAIAQRADVARVDGNPQIAGLQAGQYHGAAPAAPTALEPNIAYTNADDVWALGFTGQDIVVGGQDTGYAWDHPALQPHYRGWDGLTADHDYNWHDSIHAAGSNCGPDSLQPCDDNSHGTHTLGTVLGDDGGTNQIGMAPGADWIGCRNMNEGIGSPATYLECFEFFLAPYPLGGDPLTDGDPTLAPDVTNNSWTCPELLEGCSANTLLAAVQAQRAAGILTVVSAGNSGPGCSTVKDPPAHHAEVYSVGALNTGTDTIASFSSRGPIALDGSNRRKPDLTAPGTFVRSSLPGGGYGNFSGTSMAAPHVAGAVALLWSARSVLRGQVALTEQILNASAVPIAASECGSSGVPNNTFGHGRLDVLAAVNLTPAESGGLSGLATDASTGQPVPLAAIQATLSTTPTLQFQFPAGYTGQFTQTVFAGVYTLTATAPGYEPFSLGGLSVNSGLTSTLPVELTPLDMPAATLYLPVISQLGTLPFIAVPRAFR
jgi:subtilisin family serine protease